ncbi:MAG: phosphomannomutase/phosphoglucomutase, partial [Patescibacteria group bacterium]
MNINPTIFKSYDIRGIYPDELNKEAAYAIGRAYARRTRAEQIVVGSDMRLSSPTLKEQFVRGVTDEGANAVDIGLVPIDAVYFAVRKQNYPAGAMITASHNPKEYNGFKLPLPGIGWVRGEELREDVLNLPAGEEKTKGDAKEFDIMPDYIKHVLSFCDLTKIKPLTIAVDAGNGMAGKVVPLLEPHLPIKIIPLNFTLDGSFPAHPSNPLLPESQEQITKAVKANQADCGVIFDGDTDRLFFVDERGNFVRADMTLLILAKEFLRREPGAGIVYNAICSKAVPEIITEWGGRPIRSKVGYVHISQTMSENQGVMGGELSAHYSFRDNGYADSGFIAWLILLELL